MKARTTFWSQFYPTTFMWVPRMKAQSHQACFVGHHPFPAQPPAGLGCWLVLFFILILDDFAEKANVSGAALVQEARLLTTLSPCVRLTKRH